MDAMELRIFGFPVRIQPVFFIITGLLALSRINQPWSLASWIAVVLVSVLLHELGHALAFRYFGQSPSIELHGMGGHTRGSAGLTPGQDIIVSLAGPALGLVLGGLIYAVSYFVPAVHSSQYVSVVIGDLIWVNVGWGVLNLLPILPLDGGRVLIAVLRQRRPAGAIKLAHQVSMVVAALAAAAALIYGMTYGALLAGMFAVDNYRNAQRAA
jgi:Zn-dependent protease